MSKFRIKYNYNSGDSENSYSGLEGFVEIYWEDLENAKTNLKRIKEHYEQYKKLNSWNIDEDEAEKIINENKDKDWFVAKKVFKIKDKNSKSRFHNSYYIEKLPKDIQNNLDKYEIKEVFDPHSAENYIILYTDNNKPFQFFPSWCGYFESLNFVEIFSEIEQNDLKYVA